MITLLIAVLMAAAVSLGAVAPAGPNAGGPSAVAADDSGGSQSTGGLNAGGPS